MITKCYWINYTSFCTSYRVKGIKSCVSISFWFMSYNPSDGDNKGIKYINN